MNTAQYIVKRLEELGINEFFGIPDCYNYSLIYTVENNTSTRWIGCTNELNAGYAADGYARIRGYGAVITSFGAGELSVINAIAGSFAENVPVVNIVGLPSTGTMDKKLLVRHCFQDFNYKNFIKSFESVTAATAFLAKDNAKIEIDRVLKVLVKEKKPVYIAIPEDVAKMEISDRDVTYDWISDKNTLEKATKKIADKISASQKPVIIGDVLIKRFDAKIEFKEFVSKSGIPASNFMMGTNLIDMDYEKYIGSYFGNYKNPIAQKYIEETDCLIAIGTIYSDVNSYGQSLPFKINDHIAIYGDHTYIEGKKYDNIKMSDVLEALTELVEPTDIEINKPNIGLKQINDDNEKLSSSYIFPRIQAFIKDNDIIITESGSASYGVAQMKLPQSTEVQFQVLWEAAGWATPAALGACLAKPQSRIVLITGDGSHLQTAMEIGTMLRYGVKPIVIILNNNGYTIKRLASNNSSDNFSNVAKLNFAKFARAFDGDIWATKTEKKDDFDKALKVTQIMNKMCYIEACTDEFDTLPIVKEITNTYKSDTQATSDNNVYQSIKDITEFNYSNSYDNIEFETVVHKGLDEEKVGE